MQERAILIHYDTQTGQFKIEAEGFEGLSCLEATEAFEAALGVVNESDRTFKPEAETHASTRISQTSTTRLRL